MTIKKFQGKTQEEATEKARQELGAGAVVMNVKEIKPKGLFNFFKGSTFEVTAAIEEKEQFLNAVQMAAMQQKRLKILILPQMRRSVFRFRQKKLLSQRLPISVR